MLYLETVTCIATANPSPKNVSKMHADVAAWNHEIPGIPGIPCWLCLGVGYPKIPCWIQWFIIICSVWKSGSFSWMFLKIWQFDGPIPYFQTGRMILLLHVASPHLPIGSQINHLPVHPGLRDQRAGPAAFLGRQGPAGTVWPGAPEWRAQGGLGAATLGKEGSVVEVVWCLEMDWNGGLVMIFHDDSLLMTDDWWWSMMIYDYCTIEWWMTNYFMVW